MTQVTEHLLDVAAAADYLQVKASWLYSNHEELPTLRVGKQLRWRRSDLDQWLDDHRSGEPA